MSARIVTVTPTINDSTVVRWYGSLQAVALSHDIISASRNGVTGGGAYITEADWEAASSAHEALVRDQNADLKYLATHRRNGFMGPFEPVTL